MKQALIIIIAFLAAFSLKAQERMIVRNADNNGQGEVWIKWFDEKVIYLEGINIYRISQDNNREKLNSLPIKKGIYKIPSQEFITDSSLKQYIEIINTATPKELKGVLSVFLIIKMLENNHFAQYVGSMYCDNTVPKGGIYTYEIFEIVGGKERLIEKSTAIQVQNFVKEKAPDSLSVVAYDARIVLKWQPAEKLFWGVDVYRKTSINESFVRITQKPLMISKVKKENGTESYPDEFFVDTDVINGVSYTYKIIGIDYFARQTEFSNTITVTPKDKAAPIPPQNTRVKVGLFDV